MNTFINRRRIISAKYKQDIQGLSSRSRMLFDGWTGIYLLNGGLFQLILIGPFSSMSRVTSYGDGGGIKLYFQGIMLRHLLELDYASYTTMFSTLRIPKRILLWPVHTLCNIFLVIYIVRNFHQKKYKQVIQVFIHMGVF